MVCALYLKPQSLPSPWHQCLRRHTLDARPSPCPFVKGIQDCHCCNEGLSEAQSNVDKLRQVLDTVTAGLEEGRAQHQHQRQLALSRRRKPVPYSPWLSQPFLKVPSPFLICS